jgi:hypothetical protein
LNKQALPPFLESPERSQIIFSEFLEELRNSTVSDEAKDSKGRIAEASPGFR